MEQQENTPFARVLNKNPVNTLVVSLSIIYLYNLIINWSITIMMFQSWDQMDTSLVEYLAPILLLPIGIIGFWKLKKFGWIIITFLYTYFTFSIFYFILTRLKRSFESSEESGGMNSILDEIGFTTGMETLLLQFLLYLAIVVFVNQPKITNSFSLTKNSRLTTMGIALIVTSIFWFTFL